MIRSGQVSFAGERGSAALELALMLPVLALITFGMIDFARLFYAYTTVASAAHEAVAYAANHGTDTDFLLLTSTEQAAILTNVAAAESGGFLIFSGSDANTTFSQPALVSGTSTTDMQRVQLTYSFKPLTSLPLKGSIPVTAVAAAR